jgi:hypothetical protein
MKNTVIFAVFLLVVITVVGCNSGEKDRAEMEKMKQDSIKTADSVTQVAQNQEIERKRIERNKALEKGDTFTPEAEATLQAKIKEGKVFLLSDEGETMPFKFEGGKIMAVTMPDGKLYQVEKDGDKVMLMVPGQGKMERKMVNGKMYLVDSDDKMYTVKVVNKKLVAVLDDGSEIKLARK